MSRSAGSGPADRETQVDRNSLRVLPEWSRGCLALAIVRRIDASDPQAVSVVAHALRDGAAVVLPTDTVYGLAVAADVPGATSVLFELKGRPSTVPLAVLVEGVEQAVTLCDPPPDPVMQLLQRFWPGPLTVVLHRRRGIDVELGGDGSSVGIRCPDSALVRAVARAVGPLVTTSANPHAQPTPVSAAEVIALLGDGVAVVVDGGTCDGVASTVIDGRDDDLPVLRQGPITQEQVRGALLR